MRVLLIEDDSQVRGYIVKGMREAGHVIDAAADGEEGLHLAQQESYDVIILDRMLPKRDGLSLLSELRGSGHTTPVLILSALGDVDDRVTGLRAGGDDYLVKPFAFAELLARTEVLARRNQMNASSGDHRLQAQGIVMDLLSRKVSRDGEEVMLQAREFRLLEYLMRNKGHIVTRTMLLEAVWDYHFDPQTNVIDVHISRLRKKLGDKEATIIKTVRGSGYLVEDVS